MAAMFAWPSELKRDSVGLAVTFILPAHKCNLSCKFCAIKQRREAIDSELSIEDYLYFLEDVVKHNSTAIMAIQGYEPLLPEAWPYTSALLAAGRRLGIPTSLVTNGTLLADRYEELADLEPTGVTVSIDSNIASEHDKIRGKSGAFDASMAGLRLLASVEGFASKITISSVLSPRRRHLLQGMPQLLRELGLKHWVVAPLFRMGKTGVGGPVGAAHAIVQDLQMLSEAAAQYDVSLILDDELKTISKDEFDYAEIAVRQFDRPDGLIRLVPSGACSAGQDILRRVDRDTPVWLPATMEPHQFVRSIVPFVSEGLKQAA